MRGDSIQSGGRGCFGYEVALKPPALCACCLHMRQRVIPNIRNNVEFGKEAAQIFCLEQVTIASMARHE